MKNLLNLFRWQDGLDILILTFVFYRLYLWLRKKRALRMIVAILALPLYYLIGRWIDLPLSVWGLENLWAVILLVLVVIFQQEIREVLGSITLPTFLFGKPERHPLKALDKIIEATFRMAEKRTGGLIVLQREDELDDFIHGQTLLDAEMNEDLLISIFNPQSPLHDGAVIIRGDHIRYATALLPVSQVSSLPKEWGTRHRAALGITEVSDADCIVISEERQEVLLASKGKIEKQEKKEDLKRSLTDFPPLLGEKEGQKRWSRTIFEDIPQKALLVLLACLLWIFVIGMRQGQVSFKIPMEYYSIPNNLMIAGEWPKEVDVRLRGSQKLLSSLDPDRLRVHVDLTHAHVGKNQIPLSEANINAPSGISATHFSPQKITLQLSEVSDPSKKP
jgi:diadenylate cyclase